MKITLRGQHGYDVEKASEECGLSCPEPTLTQQHEADETDINFIVHRFGLTGQIPAGRNIPTYQDFSEATDFQGAMDLIIQAQEAFQELPAQTRAQFQNDPGLFLDFCETNRDPEEWQRLGLASLRKINESGEPGGSDPPAQ